VILGKQTWTDGNGRKHKLYTVRSLGPGRGFGVIDTRRNAVFNYPFQTRGDAWDYIESFDDGETGW
jgi:hypothetical protein